MSGQTASSGGSAGFARFSATTGAATASSIQTKYQNTHQLANNLIITHPAFGVDGPAGCRRPRSRRKTPVCCGGG